MENRDGIGKLWKQEWFTPNEVGFRFYFSSLTSTVRALLTIPKETIIQNMLKSPSHQLNFTLIFLYLHLSLFRFEFHSKSTEEQLELTKRWDTNQVRLKVNFLGIYCSNCYVSDALGVQFFRYIRFFVAVFKIVKVTRDLEIISIFWVFSIILFLNFDDCSSQLWKISTPLGFRRRSKGANYDG